MREMNFLRRTALSSASLFSRSFSFLWRKYAETGEQQQERGRERKERPCPRPGVYKWEEVEWQGEAVCRNLDHQIGSLPRRTLNSRFSRFETNLESRQQTCQNENPSGRRIILFLFFLENTHTAKEFAAKCEESVHADPPFSLAAG